MIGEGGGQRKGEGGEEGGRGRRGAEEGGEGEDMKTADRNFCAGICSPFAFFRLLAAVALVLFLKYTCVYIRAFFFCSQLLC